MSEVDIKKGNKSEIIAIDGPALLAELGKVKFSINSSYSNYVPEFLTKSYTRSIFTALQDIETFWIKCMNEVGQYVDNFENIPLPDPIVDDSEFLDDFDSNGEDVQPIVVDVKIFTSDGSKDGNAFDIWKFLKYQKLSDGIVLSDAQVAAILGNIDQEDNTFNPDVYESDATQKDERKKGYGIIQWTNSQGMEGGRRDQMFEAAGSEERAKSLDFQCEYLLDEVLTPREEAKFNHSGNPDYFARLKEKGFFEENDPATAAQIFHDVVEGSADTNVMLTRGEPAKEWYDKFSKVQI